MYVFQHEFNGQIVQHTFFKGSSSVSEASPLVLSCLYDIVIGRRFLIFYMHTYSNDHVYLLMTSKHFYYTTDFERKWVSTQVLTLPNSFGLQILPFHLQSDYLIWSHEEGHEDCHVKVLYSWDHGRK